MDSAISESLVMPLKLLREITNGFSEERKLGSGSYGKVYLGVHQDGRKIAVKKLYDMPGLDDVQFKNEFQNLTRLQHQNIVQLVGYCHDIQEVQVMHEGRLVLAEKTHRALCLEYMSNGSLDQYLSDECDTYDWQKGYRIIKGVCQGLNYLHNELKPPIYHFDLKPANILLDENMVPRIADFGVSRLFGDERTQATKSSLGTIGYLPPEYINKNLISSKFDIFSLGVVIIKIMAGRAGYFNSAEMSSQEFTNLVQENWTNRLLETTKRRNAYSEQVKICIEIGLSCVEEDRHKRPAIQDIVDRLNETETKCTYADSLGDIPQPGNISNPNHQQATLSKNNSSLSYNMETDRNTFPQHAQDRNDQHFFSKRGDSPRNDQHAEQIYHGSTSNENIAATTHSNCFEENANPTEARLDGYSPSDDQAYSVNVADAVHTSWLSRGCFLLFWGASGLSSTRSQQSASKLDISHSITFDDEMEDGKSHELRVLSLDHIKAATGNFSESNKLGEDVFGPVYMGALPGGEEVSVKRLCKISGQGLEAFKNVLILIAKLQHQNLVRLLACCIQGEEKILVYQYMPNKTLDAFIFSTNPEKRGLLDWRTRFDIIEGIARGLIYLHMDSHIVHCDLKASNILLDTDMNPKISDYGMARFFGGNKNHVVGTFGYMSPEYALEGMFSLKSDVYSFGVLILEIITGKRAVIFNGQQDPLNITGYAWQQWNEDKGEEIIDPLIKPSCSIQQVLRCIHVALLCVQDDAYKRPDILTINRMLSSDSSRLPLPMAPHPDSFETSLSLSKLRTRGTTP